jgi:hypothetical protein
LGAIFVPVDCRLAKSELFYQLNECLLLFVEEGGDERQAREWKLPVVMLFDEPLTF